jgi:RND superfamily putative drug exporter
MFILLAKLTAKYKIAIILGWIVLSAVLVILAPSLSKVGVTDDSQFLPRDTESIQAQNLIKTRFAAGVSGPPGSAVIVTHNAAGLNQGDRDSARSLNDWLVSADAPRIISAVNSEFTNGALKSTLESADNTTLLISLSLSEASSSAAAREAVSTIRKYVSQEIKGSEIYVTGSAGVSSDALTSIRQTIDKATLVTVILVVVLLLIIYRSPIAMLVPLITIGVAYLISRSLTGFIAQAGLGVSTLVDAYLVVTLFGIGTDYCLFMVSRFKEEILQNEREKASALTLHHIGPVILASAITVIVALLCLGISRFGMNRNSGLILAMGVAITLLAGLTLTPALISAFGRRLLWPGRLQTTTQRKPGFWHKVGQQIVQRPLILIIPIILVLALPYLALPRIGYSASMISQMPADMDSVKGYQLWKEHFPTGRLNPVDLVVESGSGLVSDAGKLQTIGQLANAIGKQEGVSGVIYYGAPAQNLHNVSLQIRTLGNNLGPAALGQLSLFQSLEQTLNSVVVQYPGVTQSVYFQQTVGSMQKIAIIVTGIKGADLQNTVTALTVLKPLLSGLADNLENLTAEFNLQVESPFVEWLKSHYFSMDGKIARLSIYTVADPYSKEGIAIIAPIIETTAAALQSLGWSESKYHVGGIAADQADILEVNDQDFLRVLGLAVIGILLVTILLLRSIIAPLYMIVTVLFNFGATLGIAAWLFFDVLHQSAMIYMLPIFVFVILVAVGADYNIFLVTRIREEAHKKPLKEAIRAAVGKTGGVITSCGLILAGTFATLTTAPLQMVFQVGAAIAIGVLIDTFLVRALLIPCISSLLGRWNWWPSRLSK